MTAASAETIGSAAPPAAAHGEIRRRITYLMLVRVVLITLVLGVTVLLHLASPELLAMPNGLTLLAIVIATYALSLAYAAWLPRVANPLRFADIQVAGDLLITSALVHLTGGAQSGYTLFYPLSIIGTATIRHRRGALVVAAFASGLFVAVSVAGWAGWLPALVGQRMLPWEMSAWAFGRHMVLNIGAFAGVAFLAASLGEQLARADERLESQRARSLDLAALNDNVIRSLSSGLMTIDQAGKVMTANDAACEILGVPHDATAGRLVGQLVPELAALLERHAGETALSRLELPVRRREDDSDLSLEATLSPLFDHRHRVIGRILSFVDLTELRRMETQVKQAERLAVVGRLAAGIAHEIRNPLASISGSIELLREAPQVEAENRALMDIVLREVDRLNSLVTDLLEYARPRDELVVGLPIGDLIEETVRVFAQDRSGPRIAVRYRATPAAARAAVQAAPAQVRQVIWNLLRNAVEAMPQGGRIDVLLDLTPKDDVTWAQVTVSDTGCGIAPEDRDRVFEPFFTTKPTGSGLGLAMVQRIVSEHGGQVLLESQLGHGTRFTVRLPLGEGSASSAKDAASRAQA